MAAGEHKTPQALRALPAAGGAHGAGGKPRRRAACREPGVQTRPVQHLARLSLRLSGPWVSQKHSHLSEGFLPSMVASPPIQPAAKSSSWKLPMAGATAPRPPGVGLVPIQCVRGMARGRGALGGQRKVGAHHGPTPNRVSSPPCRAGGGAHLSPGPPAADSTPPADLKGAARRRGDGAPRATALPRPGGAKARRGFPGPSPLTATSLLATAEPRLHRAKVPARAYNYSHCVRHWK